VGSGFNVRGSSSRRATGSTEKVTSVLAHLFEQREAAITRAEKNRVAMSLYGLALSHPNRDFWTTIKPGMSNIAIAQELQRMGVNVATALAGHEPAPTIRDVSPVTGLVVDRPNPMYKNLPGAITLRLNGEDRVLMLNTDDPRAKRLATDLKNLDGLTRAGSRRLDHRQGHALDRRGEHPVQPGVRPPQHLPRHLGRHREPRLHAAARPRPKVLAMVPWPCRASRARARERRGQRRVGAAVAPVPGRRRPHRLARQLERSERAHLGHREGAAAPGSTPAPSTPGAGGAQAATCWTASTPRWKTRCAWPPTSRRWTKGLSRGSGAHRARAHGGLQPQGPQRPRAGPAVRLLQRLGAGHRAPRGHHQGPHRQGVLAGGMLLGVMQALALLAFDYDDDELAHFDLSRAFIVPLGLNGEGKKHFLKLPYPIGLNVLPNTGRVLTQLGLSGGKDRCKNIALALGELVQALNPLGGRTC
jgi:hypothetical protein